MKKRTKVGSDGKADSTHYGGADNPHETIKCLHAWGLERDALCWNSAKYISRAGKKDGATLLRDLEKAYYYLGKKIERLKAEIRPAVGRPRHPRQSGLEKTARVLGVLRPRERLHVGRVNA